jgi:hypothetical protein
MVSSIPLKKSLRYLSLKQLFISCISSIGIDGFEYNLDKTCTSEFFQRASKYHESEGLVLFEVFKELTRACFIQISRDTILLRINNIHKNVRENCRLNLRL